MSAPLRKIAINTVLFIVVTSSALFFSDYVFILYEKRYLQQNIFEVDGVYDLYALLYNDTTVAAKKPTGEFRALSLGDSFTQGITRYPYSYTQVIARTVNARLTDPKIRAVNLGEAATGLEDYVKAYEFWSKRLEHDAVIVNVYLGNDLAFLERYRPWTLQPVMSDHPFDLIDGRRRTLVPEKYPLRIFDYAYAYINQIGLADHLDIEIDDSRYKQEAYFQVDKSRFLEQVHGNLEKTFQIDAQSTIVEGYRDISKLFRTLDIARANGKHALVTLGPFEAQVEDELREKLLRKFQDNPDRYDIMLPSRIIEEIRQRVSPRLSVLDLTPYFRCRAAKGDDLYFRENTHYSVKGDELHGTVTGNYILKEWFHEQTPLPQYIAECKDWADPYTKNPPSKTDAEVKNFVDNFILR